MTKCKDCLHQCYTEEVEESCNFFVDSTKYAEVVRCKDCEFFTEHNDVRTGKPMKYGECHRYLSLLFRDEDFCSYGERKTN